MWRGVAWRDTSRGVPTASTDSDRNAGFHHEQRRIYQRLRRRPGTESATSPHLKHIEAKHYMLELINVERRRAGVSAVTMGDNVAAQLHADSSLENCTSSHWGIDGLKPYMRYSLAGGYQSNGENGSGLDYCIKAT